MDKTWRKALLWSAAGLAGAVLIAYGFWPDPVPVDIAIIERGDVIVTVEDEGVAQVREVYSVSSPIAGTVLRSPVEVGDTVLRGQTVVASVLPTMQSFLDPRSASMGEADVKAAEAALRLAHANHERATAEAQYWRKQLSRVEQLSRGTTISESTVDLTRMEAEARIAAEASAKAQVDLRKRELERAKAALLEPPAQYAAANDRCCLTVMAPEDGVVLKITNESETVISAGAPLLEIGNPKDLEIVAELLSRDAVRVSEGAKATIEGWGGPTLNARVRRIDTAGFEKVSALGIEEQRVKIWLDLTDPPKKWKRLGHDYRIIARIVVQSAEDVLRIPVSALFRQGEDWAVFVESDRRARLMAVKIGERNSNWAAVVEGLKEKDVVILYPSDRLTDAVSVKRRATE
jgi:HlyD family secretion protein